MRVRFEMVLELLFEYGEHESSSDAHLVILYHKRIRYCHFVTVVLAKISTSESISVGSFSAAKIFPFPAGQHLWY